MPASANYVTEASKRNINIGYLIDIPSVGKSLSNVVVTGLAAGSQENILTSMSWNPQKISVDSVNISVGMLTVKLIDVNSTVIGVFNGGTFHKEQLTLKRGFEGLDIADWSTLGTFTIYDVSSNDQNEIIIKARDRMTELNEPVLLPQTYLTQALTDSATDATVDSVSDFTSSGDIFVGSELIPYSGTITSPHQFNGLTRGSNATSHEVGSVVYQEITIEENPIDAMLQLMISPNGGITGSLYDGLSIGLSIDETTIDVQSFEDVRDNSTLTGDVWRLNITGDIPNLLNYFEREFFEVANVRITINNDGKFSCSLLQEVTIDQLGGTLTRDDVLDIPRVSSNSDRVFNQVKVAIDYNPETKEFENEYEFNDTDSQATFGIIPRSRVESKGLKSGLDGEALAQQFANKLLRRIAEPYGQIDQVKVLWNKQFFNPGDKVILTHDQIYNFNEGKVGITNMFTEILSAKWDFNNGIVTYAINNSPNLSANFGFIGPSSLVASGTHTQTVFDVEAGEVARAEWEAGQVIALWAKEGGSAPVDTATIESISTDEITLVSPGFSVTPTTAHRIRYADFDNVTSAQKAYAFFSDDNNDFSDGTASYKIS